MNSSEYSKRSGIGRRKEKRKREWRLGRPEFYPTRAPDFVENEFSGLIAVGFASFNNKQPLGCALNAREAQPCSMANIRLSPLQKPFINKAKKKKITYFRCTTFHIQAD